MNEEITQKVFDTYCAMVKAQAILAKHEEESGVEYRRLLSCLHVAENAYDCANSERLEELDRLARRQIAIKVPLSPPPTRFVQDGDEL